MASSFIHANWLMSSSVRGYYRPVETERGGCTDHLVGGSATEAY